MNPNDRVMISNSESRAVFEYLGSEGHTCVLFEFDGPLVTISTGMPDGTLGYSWDAKAVNIPFSLLEKSFQHMRTYQQQEAGE